MIHVAPCSCELHVRIRELEAETKRLRNERNAEMARAEKAEKELALAEATERNHEVQFASQGDRLREWKARAEKAEQIAEGLKTIVASHVQARREAEARVAELERTVPLDMLIKQQNKACEREAD